MAAVPIELTIDRGEDWQVSFNLRNDMGSYINLSGHTIVGKMSRNFTSVTKYSLNAQITDASTGLIKLSMPNEGGQLVTKTQDLKPGRYVYNIFVTDPSGNTEKVIDGIIIVNPSVL